MIINEITGKVIGCAFKVHKALGPGLLENTYKECMNYELNRDGLYVEKEKALPLVYHEVNLEVGFRVDLFVENKVVVELKCVEAINNIHIAQTLTYIRLAGVKIGLLINFYVDDLKKGIKRLII